MDLQKPFSLRLLLIGLWVSTAFAEGPLEPVALAGQCLQAGAFQQPDDRTELPKWLSSGASARRGYLVTLADCDQSPQQDWTDDDGQLSGMYGELAVMHFKNRIMPVVKEDRAFFKTFPVTLQQGLLIFVDRKNQSRCLIPKSRFHFEQATLEDCQSQSELMDQSRWFYAMPPDPGEEGNIGLAGIDSDQDGIRDDVQRFISVVFQDESEEIKEAVSDVVVTKQEELVHAYDKEKVLELSPEREATFNCFLHRTKDDRRKYYVYRKRLDAKLYNTYDRLKAKNKINSYFGGMIIDDPGDYGSYCSPDTDSSQDSGEDV